MWWVRLGRRHPPSTDRRREWLADTNNWKNYLTLTSNGSVDNFSRHLKTACWRSWNAFILRNKVFRSWIDKRYIFKILIWQSIKTRADCKLKGQSFQTRADCKLKGQSFQTSADCKLIGQSFQTRTHCKPKGQSFQTMADCKLIEVTNAVFQDYWLHSFLQAPAF